MTFVRRDGPAHSSDREGIFKIIWNLRKLVPTWFGGLKRTPQGWDGHSGSVDWYDFFGLPPYNDNEVKAKRRRRWGPLVEWLT